MSNFFKHLKTIRTHRKYVKKACFNMSILLQGLLHDLSKYSLTELKIYKYYTGTLSPHDTARNTLGYSPSWYHHRNRNKHHSEYWVDSFEKMNAVKMPYRFVVEMFCDFIAAGKAYNKEGWSVRTPWDYWEKKCRGVRILELETEYLFEKLLWNLHESKSEKDFYKQYKRIKKYLKINYENGTLITTDSEAAHA
jgi:hypothetical protein